MPMRRSAVFIAMLLLAMLAAGWAWDDGAHATTTDPRLDAVASQIAGRDVTVLCYAADEDNRPAIMSAWGYVYLWDTRENMDGQVCEGALAIAGNDGVDVAPPGSLDAPSPVDINPPPLAKIPYWEQALGALVLTHESYHLNLTVGHRGDEARTECRTIKHTADTIQKLGGNMFTVARLMPYALAIHWRITSKYPEYSWPGCQVPWWWTS